MNRKTLVLIVALATLGLFGAGTVGAQVDGMAFVDLSKLQQLSKRLQSDAESFKASYEKKQKQLQDMAKQLQELQDRIKKQGPMMNEEQRDKLLKELGEKEIELKLAKKRAENQLQNEERAYQQEFNTELQSILNNLRQKMKLRLIFRSEALLSAADALDISKQVAEAYDSAAPRKGAGNRAPRQGQKR